MDTPEVRSCVMLALALFAFGFQAHVAMRTASLILFTLVSLKTTMSLICDYDHSPDGIQCNVLISSYRLYDSGMSMAAASPFEYCTEYCNNNLDCVAFVADTSDNSGSFQCWIGCKKPSAATVGINTDGFGKMSYRRKIADSCHLPSSPIMAARDLEKCRGTCVFNILLIIPGLIIYSIMGFFILCFLCCLPCICVELCRPSPSQLKYAAMREENAEGDATIVSSSLGKIEGVAEDSSLEDKICSAETETDTDGQATSFEIESERASFHS